HPKPKIDAAAVAAHGMGRGDFAALVFSGAIDELGEAPGLLTWSTLRKYALADPRVESGRDLARASGSPLPPWPHKVDGPVPGVCFVFTDDGHPAVDALRAREGVHLEHYVVLRRLTLEALPAARIDRFLKDADSRPIAVLGYGDQGRRIVSLLL